MRLLPRRAGPPAEVVARAALPAGEKVLAAAAANDGSWLLGTRRVLVLVPPLATSGTAEPPRSIPWEQVEDAGWDQEESRLRVAEIGKYGEPRPSHTFGMDEPTRLLQLVRERVTASVVLQRRVRVRDRLGLTVIARRSPDGGAVHWMHVYDRGLDPTDPEVMALAEEALVSARVEVGEHVGPI